MESADVCGLNEVGGRATVVGFLRGKEVVMLREWLHIIHGWAGKEELLAALVLCVMKQVISLLD